MNILNRIILTLFLLSGSLIADEDSDDKPFMQVGYYRVVESILQIPSLQFKDSFNELCYVKFWSNEDGRYGNIIIPIDNRYRSIEFRGNSITYVVSGYYNNIIESTNQQTNVIQFDSKKGNDIIFLQKNLFEGDVTRKVVLTYLGKDLKQAVKKLK